MASEPSLATDESLLSHVSSLYGPGNMTCWYLTLLSLVVSWFFHPNLKLSSFIEADLAISLTLPTVAAVHTVYLAHSYLTNNAATALVAAAAQASNETTLPSTTPPNNTTTSTSAILERSANVNTVASTSTGTGTPSLLQAVAATEAPLIVIESFFVVASMFIYSTILRNVIEHRPELVGRIFSMLVVAILCLAIDGYLHTARFSAAGLWCAFKWNSAYCPATSLGMDTVASFRKRFFTLSNHEFRNLLTVFCIQTAAVKFSLPWLRQQWKERPSWLRRGRDGATQPRGPAEVDAKAMQRHSGVSARDAGREQAVRWTCWHATKCVGVVAYLAVIAPAITALNVIVCLISDGVFEWRAGESVWKVFPAQLAHDFFPRTTSSMGDLDQAVAAAAGATILSFRVLDALWSRYKARKVRRDQARKDLEPAESVVQLGEAEEEVSRTTWKRSVYNVEE